VLVTAGVEDRVASCNFIIMNLVPTKKFMLLKVSF
jgi:hypothetical protein